MRKVSIALPVVALIAVLGASAIGQQSPSLAYPVPGTEATLADAARTNNFPLFDALYSRGSDDASRFGELHAFWQWSMTDPVGGFYGDAMHAKFAAEYPDYAEFIADYGVVDAKGNAFYPSAETRTFLLKHALDGTAPVIRIAQKPKPKPAVVHKHAPVVVAQAAPHFTAQPAPAPVVVAPAPVQAPVPVQTVRVVVQRPVPQPKPAPASVPASGDRLARGFALIVAGLIAAGALTVMLRTPSETA